MYDDVVAIILAGGKGSRFGEQKQFILFNEKPLWKHVYDKALKLFMEDNICTVGITIEGGETRSHSVINGLKYFENKKSKPKKVIIMEAARPLVTVEQISVLADSKDPSCSFVMPLVNSIIKNDGSYINRSDYYELLTPQAFNYEMLIKAYSSKRYWDMTDETRVIYEYYGIKPMLIETGQNLFKVTYARDIAILKQIAEFQIKGVL